MATMYDAPMHDFSQDSNMDADMIPSAASDTDWLQVENMMEDGDSQKPPHSQEVDMGHDDLQEFEMGDADADFGGNFDEVALEDSGSFSKLEPQDQEIPDASRAPSPSAQAAIHKHMPSFAGSLESEQEPAQPTRHSSPSVESPVVRKQSTPDQLTTFPNNETEDEDPAHPTDFAHEETLTGDAGNPPIIDGQDNSTISGDSARSPKLHPQQEPQDEVSEPFEVLDASENLTHDQPDQYEGPPDLENDVHQSQNVEANVENQLTVADDDGLLMDPPPYVLLEYPFDNSRFAFFTLPEIPHTSEVSTDLAREDTSATPHDHADAEAKPEGPEGHSTLPDHAGSNSPILLFREQFALYYEPLSLIFEALRANGDVNVEGRFDNNVELVISAPELDLTLPEDNIYSREVSLHDLGVLHNGCELSGPLSLRLETVSPRFGTRYKAIRDEIVRVVSQQEEEERQNLYDPADESIVGLPFHNSPEDQPQDEGSSYQRTTGHEDPEANEDSGDRNPESDAQLNNANPELGTSESGENENTQEDTSPDEPVGGEDDVSHHYDVGETEEHDTEQNYTEEEGFDANYEDEDALYDDVEDAEQPPDEQPPLEEQAVAPPSGGPEAPLELADSAPDDYDEATELFGDGRPPLVTGDPTLHPALSPGYTAPVDSSDVQESNTDEISQEISQPAESNTHSLGNASHVFDPPVKILSDAEPSLTEDISRSRSKTPRSSSDNKPRQDELIAYEDAVEDETQLLSIDIEASHSAPTSKRSYDELESEGLEDRDTLNDSSTDSKRLRVE